MALFADSLSCSLRRPAETDPGGLLTRGTDEHHPWDGQGTRYVYALPFFSRPTRPDVLLHQIPLLDEQTPFPRKHAENLSRLPTILTDPHKDGITGFHFGMRHDIMSDRYRSGDPLTTLPARATRFS